MSIWDDGMTLIHDTRTAACLQNESFPMQLLTVKYNIFSTAFTDLPQQKDIPNTKQPKTKKTHKNLSDPSTFFKQTKRRKTRKTRRLRYQSRRVP